MKKSICLSIIMFYLINDDCLAQRVFVGPEVIESESRKYASRTPSYADELDDLKRYIGELTNNSSEKYQFILVYPIANQSFSDNHWETFFEVENTYRDVLVILILTYPALKSKLNNYHIVSKDYVLVDGRNLFQQQPFYSYSPILYEIKNNEIINKFWMSWNNSYQLKLSLWRKLKVN